MSSCGRFFLFGLLCCVSTYSMTIDSALTMPAVFENFSNIFGDNDKQNSFGAAKGYIENGAGKAHTGGGYWYSTSDGGSTISSGDGTELASSAIATAVDQTERCLHVKMVTSTSEEEYPYASVGSNMTEKTAYFDVSKMTSLIVKAKGTGTVRVNLITKDYLDKKADWGFYGVDIVLTSTLKTYTTPVADILPVPYSVGDPDGDGGWSFATQGSKGLNKIELQVKDGEDADLWLYEISFTGMKYSDFDFVKLPVVSQISTRNSVDFFTVSNSQINYTASKTQSLSIDLYDLLGNKIASLFNGSVAAGVNAIPLNLEKNKRANSKYFIRVNSEQKQAVQPFMMFK